MRVNGPVRQKDGKKHNNKEQQKAEAKGGNGWERFVCW